MPDPAYFVGATAKLLQWQGTLFPVKQDGALRRANADEAGQNILDPDGEQLVCGGDVDVPLSAQLVPMRGFAFLNTAKGLYKLASTSADAATLANGLPIPYLRFAGFTSSSGILPDGNSFAYRVLIGRKETSASGEDFWTYGVPSTRLVYTNTTGSTAINPTLEILLPPDVLAGHWLFVYRSLASSEAPDDEMREVHRRELVTADFNGTFRGFQWTDTIIAGERGAALYTNPSRGGFGRANFEAPSCRAMAEYRGSLFFGDTIDQRRMRLRFAEGGDRTGQTTGIGYRTISGRRTAASADITNVTSVTGIELGMMLWSSASGSYSSWSGSAPVIVNGITGAGPYTIQTSATWGGSSDGANVNHVIVDAIHVGGNPFPVCAGDSTSLPQAYALLDAMGRATTQRTMPESGGAMRAYAEKNAFTQNSSTARTLLTRVNIVIEEKRPGLASSSDIQVSATHGTEYDPPLPAANGIATPRDMDSAGRRNGFAWSKRDEPHHVPLGNWQPIGDGSARIVAMVTARDALWMFQDDGRVWRLYGFGEASGWRVDPFDWGHILAGYNAITKLDEVIFALTTKGAINLTDAGILNISDGFIGRDLADRLPATFDALSEGIAVTANPKHKELIFTVGDGDSGGNDLDAEVYCFNVRNKRWSTWDLPHEPSSMACVDGRYFYLTKIGGGGRSYLIAERLESDAHPYADLEYAATVGGLPGATRDFNLTAIDDDLFSDAAYVPEVGDLVIDAGSLDARFFITSINGSVHVYEGAPGAASGAVTIYQAFEIDLRWRGLALGDPGSRKLFRSASFMFEPWGHAYEWAFAFDSEAESQESVGFTGEANTETQSSAQYKRAYVPRTHGRRAQLKPRLTIRQGDFYFRLVGMTLQLEVIGPRVRR